VVIGALEVEVDAFDPARAEMRATAAVAGMQGLLPQDGNLYRLSGEWRLEDGDWLLYRLRWQ